LAFFLRADFDSVTAGGVCGIAAVSADIVVV